MVNGDQLNSKEENRPFVIPIHVTQVQCAKINVQKYKKCYSDIRERKREPGEVR